ncbi:grasp-with-spasm system ATP-grasp peptide maturase [Chryseolinea sp. H1M3-3]|uniref:grasp-with-spasm system ATP-grasp peptide maturase n=1 Tax=Chryseolinea sp. H1M3-3 TaxID=3034144 RepID=UPI0023ED950D|nr:grasp-with-spasm system ATP-grasp peptide maturase [Chryseolinea sp. H1M3-3]
MILILSNDIDDGTNQVIDWLYSYGKKFIRVNGNQFLSYDSSIALSSQDTTKSIQSKLFDFDSASETDVVWFRRWGAPDSFIRNDLPSSLAYQTGKYLLGQFNIISNIFFESLSHVKWVNHPSELTRNKVHVLEQALKAGLRIPETLICSTRDELVRFKKVHGRIITKSIGDISFFYEGKSRFSIYTSEIVDEDISLVDEHFFPSLVQQYIPKQYELRIFFLDGEVYPMAIFSQTNEKTRIDFRNYDAIKPNRTVPYSLPPIIKRKIRKLMKLLDMSCGSIDMIKDCKGDYYFLEVNPVGQFGMVSSPCNYFLEKRLAEHLMKITNR